MDEQKSLRRSCYFVENDFVKCASSKAISSKMSSGYVGYIDIGNINLCTLVIRVQILGKSTLFTWNLSTSTMGECQILYRLPTYNMSKFGLC